METKKKDFKRIFVILMMLQIVLYFLNNDMYLQVSGMFIFLFFAILVGLGWILLNIWQRPVNVYQTVSLLLFVCLLISAIANPSVIEKGYILSYVFLICMVFIFSSLDLDQEDFDKISNAYILLGLIISLLIIIVHKRFYADESNRITIQIGSSPLIDPNYLGACLVGPCFLSMQKAMEGRKKYRLAYWGISIVVLIGIFMTGSRGALLAFGVGIVIIFCKKFFKQFTFKKFCILAIQPGAIFVLAVTFIPQAYLARMFDISSWMDSSNIRRLSLWENAIDHILKKPLFGYGLGSPVNTIDHAAHNTYLEFFVQFGAIGGILFVTLLGLLVLRKGNVFMKAIILSTMVWSIFIAAEATMFLWLNISLCIAYDNMKKGCYDEKNSQRDCASLQR